MILHTSVFSLATLLYISLASCYPWPSYLRYYSITPVEQISGPSDLENIAVRHEGSLLVTSSSSSSIFQVSMSSKKSAQSCLVATVPNVQAVLGIAEMEQDVFYVAAIDSVPLSGEPGLNSVWKIDLRQTTSCGKMDGGTVEETVEVSLVATMPDAQLFNSMTRLAPNDTRTLLISDASAGTLNKFDVETGAFEVVAQDPTMAIGPSGLQVGINGIRMHGANLFFVNWNQEIMARIPFSLETGMPVGPVDVIVDGVPGDDFALSGNGRMAWVAMNSFFTLVEVDILARTHKVAANSTLLMLASSVAFGRTKHDRTSVYVTGAANIAGGNGTTEGQVVRVNLPFSYSDLYL